MICLHCGKTADKLLCDECKTPDILAELYVEIRSYHPDRCENPFLAAYAANLHEPRELLNVIPELLSCFTFDIAEYYYCTYYRACRDVRFEEAAIAYLQRHGLKEWRSQRILYMLINSYLPNDFIKPGQWCEQIVKEQDFSCDLYAIAAKYYAMIGEYDLADEITDRALTMCRNADTVDPLFCSREDLLIRLEKQKAETQRYRTKKPYWPMTEERRRAIAMFYDERGIKYPRISNKPVKVPEDEFAPLNESFKAELSDYCAFWCADAFSISGVKSIYQIAAVKVRDGEVVDTFQSLVRPWDGIASRKDAAKQAGVPLIEIEGAEDVDQVLVKFFAFVGKDILVSTGALGNQAKLLSRAARYSGMKAIQNELFDLLDMAADVSSDFDLANNTREYLLEHFAIEEGKNALEKAQVNKQLYDMLAGCGN